VYKNTQKKLGLGLRGLVLRQKEGLFEGRGAGVEVGVKKCFNGSYTRCLKTMEPNIDNKVTSVPKANLVTKRFLDVFLILVFFIVFLLLFCSIAVCYWIMNLFFPKDRGPILRKVYRHGFGRLVPVFKFRVGNLYFLEEQEAKLTHKEIDKITQYLSESDKILATKKSEYLIEDIGGQPTLIGGLIKQIYLDELPQIINILLGQMTFVGPRPLPLNDPRTRPDSDGLVTIGGKEFDYSVRNYLPAGLTGLYQLNKDSRALEDYTNFMQEGVKLDSDYYNKLLEATPWQVIILDLSIIFRTIYTVFRYRNI